MSVCPSVRLSVKRVNCDKTKAPSEKSSIVTNRKSPTRFPMSLRWTAYVAHSPQRGTQRRQFFRFPYEKLTSLKESLLQSFFVWKLSAAQLYGIHWPIYPCTNGWWGMSPSTWNFRPTWSTPFWNGDFQAIFSRTISVIKISEKCSLSLIGSRHDL